MPFIEIDGQEYETTLLPGSTYNANVIAEDLALTVSEVWGKTIGWSNHNKVSKLIAAASLKKT